MTSSPWETDDGKCVASSLPASASVVATNTVIPAKAGIHFDLRFVARRESKMDPGLRRDDGVGAGTSPVPDFCFSA
jgi:hypothetical protein